MAVCEPMNFGNYKHVRRNINYFKDRRVEMAYIYSEDISKEIDLDDAIIIFDTNVWIDMYTLSPKTIDVLIRSFKENRQWFWLPKQVFYEYNRNVKRNRDESIKRFRNLKETTAQELSNIIEKFKAKYKVFIDIGFQEVEEIRDDIISALISIKEEAAHNFGGLIEGYDKEIEGILDEDIIERLLSKLSQENEFKEFTTKELLNIYEEGELRYKYRISPGFTDETKKETFHTEADFLLRKYGDLIIWKEILRYVSIKKVDVIFVENERKSDWWNKADKENKGIPKNLVEEFTYESNNKHLYMMDFEEFLFHFGTSFKLPAKTIKDITSKLNFEKKVLEYLDETIEDIFSHYIESMLEVDIENRIFEELILDEFMDYNFFGGTVEEIDNILVKSISSILRFSMYDRETKKVSYDLDVSINLEADIIEYINKYVKHSGCVEISFDFSSTFVVYIDLSKEDSCSESAYSIIDTTIKNIKNIEAYPGNFDVDVDVDEDMFRDR